MQNHHQKQETLIEFLHRTFVIYCRSIPCQYKTRDLTDPILGPLLNNPRNARISLADQTGFLVDRKEIYEGATTMMSKCFWPQPLDNNDNGNVTGGKSFPKKRFVANTRDLDQDSDNSSDYVKENELFKPCSNPRNSECKLSGYEHGRLVHKEVAILIDIYRQSMYIQDQEIIELIKERIPDPDPCSCFIIDSLLQQKWRVVVAEFRIFQESSNIATAIDIIARDVSSPREDIIIIDEKFGFEYDQYNELPQIDKPLPSPFENVLNCPKNQHMIQLAVTLSILRKNYNFNPERAVIMLCRPRSRMCLIIDISWVWAESCIERINEFLETRRNQKLLYSNK